MSFVRSGPRILIVETKEEQLFRAYIKAQFDQVELSEKVKNFEDIITVMNHHQTLIVIADNAKENIQNFDVSNSIIINDSAQSFLMRTINCGASSHVNYVRRAPRIIVMKVIGNIENMLGEIADDFRASIEPTKSVITSHSEGTVILLTRGNINKKLAFSDFYHKAVYTTEHFSETINNLDHHALKYINRSTENKDWFNLTIIIKDQFEDYKTHYDRLIYILDCLGAGMVLKEGWSEESSRFFSGSVGGGYKLTLYTYMEPLEIKKALFSLEYMENGERIADFDLYYKKKKIHWDELKIKGINTKENLSDHYRQELYKSLDEEDILYLRSLEDYIFASR